MANKMTMFSCGLVAGLSLLGCGSDDAPIGMPPSITSVSWTHPGCTAGSASDVNITIVASDPDNSAAQLSYAGSVASCSGNITATTGTVNCPQIAPYTGSVTVTDPDNNSDTQGFTIAVCTDGSAP